MKSLIYVQPPIKKENCNDLSFTVIILKKLIIKNSLLCFFSLFECIYLKLYINKCLLI